MSIKDKHPNAIAKMLNPEDEPSSVKPGMWAIVDGEKHIAVGATEETACANAEAALEKIEALPPSRRPTPRHERIAGEAHKTSRSGPT